MPYAIILRDAPGSAQPRQEHLAKHLEFVETVIDRILLAGPLRDPASNALVGSLYVLDVADEPAARRLLESDPYFAAGVWQDVSIEAFSGAAGRWVGGLAWKNG